MFNFVMTQNDRSMLDEVFEYVYVETSLKFKDYKIPSNVFLKKYIFIAIVPSTVI